MKDLFLAALHDNQPMQKLRETVINLRTQGIEKDVIISQLANMRSELPEDQEDIVLEVLDFLVGFCSPHMYIP